MNKIDGCTYQIVYADRQNLMHSKPCNQPLTASGFCVDHACCAEVLDMAQAAGYPRLEIAPGYFVRSGAVNWQGYAQKHRRERHSELMRRLRSMALQAA